MHRRNAATWTARVPITPAGVLHGVWVARGRRALLSRASTATRVTGAASPTSNAATQPRRVSVVSELTLFDLPSTSTWRCVCGATTGSLSWHVAHHHTAWVGAR
ncbi:hypothetical protein WKY82_09060 [Gordonia malaquae]|uniref:hypothetical protein n=1 Tax=Gordonia malaquae TaxID=410332 RepID=UPI0030C7928B